MKSQPIYVVNKEETPRERTYLFLDATRIDRRAGLDLAAPMADKQPSQRRSTPQAPQSDINHTPTHQPPSLNEPKM